MKIGRRQKHFDRGKWQMERERFCLTNEKPPSEPNEAVPISNILSGLATRLNLKEEGSQVFARLADEWSAIVGKEVAAHTRPGELRENKLIIYVDSSPWLDELRRYSQADILDNIRLKLGNKAIRTILLQVDPGT